MLIVLYIVIGFLAGIVSGSFGVGGGIVLVPIFVYVLKLTQHQAQGTALAVILPPVFILAVWRYYQAGNVNVLLAFWVAMGFIFGALLGATLVQSVPDVVLKRAFGGLLILVGIKMLWGR
jgi:uncharacterized protein